MLLTGVYGVKTGFTNGANRCLVTACKRGDMDIICVVLGCDTKKFRTADSVKLIEYAFNNFKYVNVSELVDKKFEEWKLQNENYFSILKSNSSKLEIDYSSLEKEIIPILKDDAESIDIKIEINSSFEAPVFPNTVVGGISISCGDKFIEYCNVFTTNEVSKKSSLDYLREFFRDYSDILNSVFDCF